MIGVGVKSKAKVAAGANVGDSKVRANGTVNSHWSAPLSPDKLEDLMGLVSSYNLPERHFDIFVQYALALRDAQYLYLKRPENKDFLKMMMSAFDQLGISTIVEGYDEVSSKFVTRNGKILSTADGYSFTPSLGGKFTMEEAYILALHVMSDESTLPPNKNFPEGTPEQRKMIENAIARLNNYVPKHQRRIVAETTSSTWNMWAEFKADILSRDTQTFKSLFGNIKPPRFNFEIKNPFAGIMGIFSQPVAATFSNTRGTKPAPEIKTNDPRVLAFIENASRHEENPGAIAAIQEAIATNPLPLSKEQEDALDTPYRDVLNLRDMVKLAKENGLTPVDVVSARPPFPAFQAVGMAMIEVRDAAQNGTFEYDRSSLEETVQDVQAEVPDVVTAEPTPEPEIEPQVIVEEPTVIEAVEENPDSSNDNGISGVLSKDDREKLEMENAYRKTILKMAANMVCKKPELFEGQSIQELNVIVSSIPGRENQDNSKHCMTMAKYLSDRGLITLVDNGQGDTIITNVVSVTSSNKYFNGMLSLSIVPHKAEWIGASVETMVAAAKAHWDMDDGIAEYVGRGIWQELQDRHIIHLDAYGRVSSIADIENVPSLREAYMGATKMPPVERAPANDSVIITQFDASATPSAQVVPIRNDDLDVAAHMAEVANDHDRAAAPTLDAAQ